MSAAPSPLAFVELPQISSRPWLKCSPLIVGLSIRCTPTAKNLLELVGFKAAETEPTKSPWETEVLITIDECRQRFRKSKRCIEYAIEEISATELVRDPERRQKLREKTGVETVGKNMAAVRKSTRPGEWFIRILPENWRQPSGDPGGPMIKPPRKKRVLEASFNARLPLAALSAPSAPASPQPVAIDTAQNSPQLVQGAFQNDLAQLAARSGREGIHGEDWQKIAHPAVHENKPPMKPMEAGDDAGRRTDEQRQGNATQLNSPAREGFRDLTQPHSGIPAPGCADAAPILTASRVDNPDKDLASQPQQAADAENKALAQQIAKMQSDGVGRQLGTCSVAQAGVLLRAARESMPGAEEIALFLARNIKESWKSWGLAVHAIRNELGGWLLKTGWPNTEPMWNRKLDPVIEVPTANDYTCEPEASGWWDRIKAGLAERMSPRAYENWLVRSEGGHVEADRLVVIVPDQITADFLEQEYAELIAEVLKTLDLPLVGLSYLPIPGRSAARPR